MANVEVIVQAAVYPSSEDGLSAVFAGMHIMASAIAGMVTGAVMILPAALGWW